MRSYASRACWLALVLFAQPVGRFAFADSNSCECDKPPGGSCTCLADESPHCRVVNNECKTWCTGSTAGKIAKADGKIISINTSSGEQVFHLTGTTTYNGKPALHNNALDLKGRDAHPVTVDYKRIGSRKEALAIKAERHSSG